ncbi:MAG: hypothetical protein LUF91_00185 [Oscillospiraceae bacterium]|nr:hypothetical protein [Oscillospiraceae bacterium]
MNTQIGKRLLNLLLVGCLCASLLPGTALATDAEGTTEPDGYINSIDVDAVDEAVDDVETITGEEAYTAPVSYADVESGTCGKKFDVGAGRRSADHLRDGGDGVQRLLHWLFAMVRVRPAGLHRFRCH